MLSVFVYVQCIAVSTNPLGSCKYSGENQVEDNENHISELLFRFYCLYTKVCNINGTLVS